MASTKHKLRVLFVDDEESIASMMRLELPRMGHDATICENGHDAVQALTDNTFDAAIIDLRMPGLSGWEVVEQLREISPETEFVISSGHGQMDDVIRALRLGAYDFLPKPCKLFEIANVLQNIAEKREMKHMTMALEGRIRQMQGRTDIVGNSAPMERVQKLIQKIAPTESTVLVLGETGTGKELVAKRIHDMSERADAPFVAVNCGALPENLVESEFFGHKKGAFTGADTVARSWQARTTSSSGR